MFWNTLGATRVKNRFCTLGVLRQKRAAWDARKRDRTITQKSTTSDYSVWTKLKTIRRVLDIRLPLCEEFQWQHFAMKWSILTLYWFLMLYEVFTCLSIWTINTAVEKQGFRHFTTSYGESGQVHSTRICAPMTILMISYRAHMAVKR
jgi:hypothetical protein